MSAQNVNLFVRFSHPRTVIIFSRRKMTFRMMHYNPDLLKPDLMNFIYFLIEFVDELVFGVGEVALPLIRDGLHLSYTQIGLLLSLPGIIAAFIEPFIGVLGDVWKRRVLILVGGLLFTLSLF